MIGFIWGTIYLGIALIVGIAIGLTAYQVYDYFKLKKLKAQMPKDLKNEEVAKDIKLPPKIIEDKKEEEQRETEQFNKHREFEKLRRLAEFGGREQTTEGTDNRTYYNPSIPERNGEMDSDSNNSKRNKKRIKLPEQTD